MIAEEMLIRISKRINEITNQLIAMEVFGSQNQPKYNEKIKELHELVKQREVFYNNWFNNFPFR